MLRSKDEIKRELNNRLNWTIQKRQAWFATYEMNGDVFFARSKDGLMRKINRYIKRMTS